MKILFTRFPLQSRLNGGAERQVMLLMEGWRKRGHDVSFAGSCPALLSMCRERGIPSLELHIGPPPVTKLGALSFMWRKRTMQRKLSELLRGFTDLDAIVMLSLSEKILLTPLIANPNTSSSAKATEDRPIFQYSNIPKIFWIEHDPIGRWLTMNPWLPQLRRLSSLATTVTVSERSKKIFEGLGYDPKRIVAIPNGIDLERFKESSPESSLSSVASAKEDASSQSSASFHIGTIARLDYEKGLDLLLEAIRDIPHTSLSIVGTGKEEPKLRSLIASSRSPNIRILPSVPDLGAFYRSLDIFVLPSRTDDPFGLVAAEAMSLGVPVIVTDACGISSYLTDNENAVIVKAGNAAAIREGIERLRDPAVRKKIGEAGREFARREFAAEKMVERYEVLLRQ